MRDGDDRDARFPFGRAKQRGHVEGHALEPRREAGRRDEVVHRERELLPFLLRIERFDVEHADAPDRWLLDLADEGRDVEVSTLRPRVREDRRQQDVLAALDRVGLDADKTQEARDGRDDAFAQELAILAQRRGRRGERRQDRDRDARARAGGVHGELRRVSQAADALAILAPRRETVLPELRLLRRERIGAEPLLRGVLLVDPWSEVFLPQVREGEHEIREIALRIYRERRDAVERRLLDERDAEPGLSAAGHPHAHRVRDEILRDVEDEAALRRPRLRVVRSTEVERSELLEVGGSGWRGHVVLPYARTRRARA